MRHGTLYVGGEPIDHARVYTVAGSDGELDEYGGYADHTWHLKPTYEVPTILREVVEAYIQGKLSITVQMGRIC